MGSSKLGYDDGRSGGTAVVDANLKVYGTDNIFAVDASVFPGIPTGNPSAMIVILSEQASARILSLRTRGPCCLAPSAAVRSTVVATHAGLVWSVEFWMQHNRL